MSNLAHQPDPIAHDLPRRIAPSAGAVALGGPVADLQRSLADRLASPDAFAVPGSSSIDRLAHAVSRLAGLSALAFAYTAVGVWWLG